MPHRHCCAGQPAKRVARFVRPEYYYLLMDPKDLVWLAGLLQGEGSFMRPAPSAPRLPIVRVSMTDRDVVEHAVRLMGVSVCRHQLSEAKPYYKDVWIATAKGTRARNLMLLLRPHMGYRRKEQIDRALSGNVF